MIRVLLFASLKDAAGESEVKLDLEGEMTARDVFEKLCKSYPDLKRYGKFTSVAVNEQYTEWSHKLKSGDELAFFPPVSGGER